MKRYGSTFVLLFVTLMSFSQNKSDLDLIRNEFQNIKSEEDIQVIMDFQIEKSKKSDVNILKAYKGAAQCMIANYVFSPSVKLKNFNAGKAILEASIVESMSVENVYLRLLIQLNIPKMLKYHKNIDGDILFLEENLASATIDITYKNLMIENLVSVTKNKEQKDTLLQISLVESS